MYFTPQKMLPMIFNCFLPFAAFFVLTKYMVHATEWQGYEEIKSAIEKGKETSEQFENSYKNLEYVGIRNEGKCTGDLHKVLRLYAKVIQIDNLDEFATVIELKQKCETKDNSSFYMSKIAACLHNYLPESCKQVHVIKDICLTIRTMKMKDLYGFVMVNESIEKTNKLYNSLQSFFTYYYICKAVSVIKTYLNKSAYEIVTEYLLEKLKQCEEKENGKFDFVLKDCAELKRMILEKFSNEDFAKSAIDEIYKSAIGISMQDFFGEIVNKAAEDILAYQTRIKLDHFDPLTIKSVIQDLYVKKCKDSLTKCVRIGYEKTSETIQEVDDELLFTAYKEYALWLKNKDYATEILPRKDNPEGFVEEYSSCDGKPELMMAQYISTAFLATINDYKYSSNLFKLRDGYQNGSIKVIINQEITEDNFPRIYTVLDNSLKSSIVYHHQIHLFNIGKVSDMIDGLKENKKCNLIYQNVNFSEKDELNRLRSCLLLKKKDDEQIVRIGCGFDLINKIPDSGIQLNIVIASTFNPVKIVIGSKRVAIKLTEKVSFKKRLLQRNATSFQRAHKTIKISIKTDFEIFKLYIKTYKDKNSIKFKGVKFAKTQKRPLWLQERKAILAKSFSKCQNLASLIQYIQDMRFMPYCSSLIDLYFPRPKNFGVEVFSLTVISDTQCNLNALVSAKLDDCQSTIEKFYIGREGTNTVKLQILMSDYSNRKVSDGHWHELVKHFLHSSKIILSFLEEILDKFIYDGNHFDASNEHDIAGVKTCNYKIYVCAILRGNRKTFVSVFGKEIYTSFEYCPMSKLLDIYAELVKDPEYLSAEHPLNMLHSSAGTPVHPIAYMFKVLSYPKSNLLKLMDMNLSYSDNKKTYKDLSEHIAHYIHADMDMEKSTANGTISDSDVGKPSIASMQEILNHEVHYLIEKINQHRDEINRKTKIRAAMFAAESFDSEDEKEIAELKSILLQEE